MNDDFSVSNPVLTTEAVVSPVGGLSDSFSISSPVETSGEMPEIQAFTAKE